MHADVWDNRFRQGYDKLMEREREQIRYRTIGQIISELPVHASLLDVGCGVATLADYLPALDYTGIDISEEALKTARDRHPGTFIRAGAEDFRTDEKFDVVLFNETLYYLEAPLKQLARYREFLSDEGSMIISIWVPDPEHPKAAHHSQLIEQIITSDLFAQCPMRVHDIKEAELQWKAIHIDMRA